MLRDYQIPEDLQNRVGALNPSTGALQGIATGYRPFEVAINSRTNRAYVTDGLDLRIPKHARYAHKRSLASAKGFDRGVFNAAELHRSHVADGVEFPVTVAIDPEAVERVARLTHRRLDPGGGFWRLQAERLLSAYVWSEGRGPADGRLVVRDVSREDLEVALRWEEH